ncbi:hypothetical protein QBC43DRAFT_307950 [Cladorrhinum sp. PSN259]|nr:hypothetical protein QBC43DRAFT_307950 [Cladorrhinum sp. PSN259]
MTQAIEDVELGQREAPARSRHRGWVRVETLVLGIKAYVVSIYTASMENRTVLNLPQQLEDSPAGYPRYSALMAADMSYQVFRRFSRLRTRLLLLKQDELAALEKQLDKLDRDDEGNQDNKIRLLSCRADTNSERKVVIEKVKTGLSEYDALVERNRQIFALDAAKPRSIRHLQRWIKGNGCIARAEWQYLTRDSDLMTYATNNDNDNALAWLEPLVEDCLALDRRRFAKDTMSNTGASRDPHVHIFDKPFITLISRMVIIPLIVVLLLTPVIICNLIDGQSARLAVIVISTPCFITALSALTKARTVELVVAGATYTTVLIVFITNTNNTTSR